MYMYMCVCVLRFVTHQSDLHLDVLDGSRSIAIEGLTVVGEGDEGGGERREGGGVRDEERETGRKRQADSQETGRERRDPSFPLPPGRPPPLAPAAA